MDPIPHIKALTTQFGEGDLSEVLTCVKETRSRRTDGDIHLFGSFFDGASFEIAQHESHALSRAESIQKLPHHGFHLLVKKNLFGQGVGLRERGFGGELLDHLFDK